MFDNWQEAAYTALKRFKYCLDSNGQPYEVWPGQYFDRLGYRNDIALFDSGRWAQPAPTGKRADWPCDRCGRHFVNEDFLRHHQRQTVEVEQMAPEDLAERKRQGEARVRRQVANETIADLAVKQGHQVKEGPGGVPLVHYG